MTPLDLSDDPFDTKVLAQKLARVGELSDNVLDELPQTTLPEFRQQVDMQVPDIDIPTYDAGAKPAYEPLKVPLPEVIKLPPASGLSSSEPNSNMGNTLSRLLEQQLAASPLPTNWLPLRGG